MKTYNLNLKFNSYEECQEWESKHIEDGRMYNGEFVLMVNHSESFESDEVELVSIITV